MNFLAHVRVALGTSEEPRHLIGAVLPDIESLLGVVLEDQRHEPAIAQGIRVHHATDAAFHGDPRFRTGSISLTRALQARGVGRGASRAVGHAGWELLLDGLLVDDPHTTQAFATALSALADLAGASEAAGAVRLRQFAGRQDATPIWAGYTDPLVVAERLQRQVAHRPLLAFPPEQIGVVGEVLADFLPGIAAVGPALIGDVTNAVRSAP